MKKLIDFDKKYMAFVARALKDMPALEEEAIEGTLNDLAARWLATRDAELGDRTPDEYFAKMAAPELMENLVGYGEAGMNVPEPLYRRISETDSCVEALARIARNRNLRADTRCTALRLLLDQNADGIFELAVDMLLEGVEEASDWLKGAGYRVVEPLIAHYHSAEDARREAILDVLCAYPGVPRTAEILADALIVRHEKRALFASFAARLGDEALLKPLKALEKMSDLTYFDYLEIQNAIEALGGEPGPERQFYGDPDFEQLRAEPED